MKHKALITAFVGIMTITTGTSVLANSTSLIGKDATAQGQLDWHQHATQSDRGSEQGMKRSEFAAFEGKQEGFTSVKDEYTAQGQYNWYKVRQ